jgi:hypothetical protein
MVSKNSYICIQPLPEDINNNQQYYSCHSLFLSHNGQLILVCSPIFGQYLQLFFLPQVLQSGYEMIRLYALTQSAT